MLRIGRGGSDGEPSHKLTRTRQRPPRGVRAPRSMQNPPWSGWPQALMRALASLSGSRRLSDVRKDAPTEIDEMARRRGSHACDHGTNPAKVFRPKEIPVGRRCPNCTMPRWLARGKEKIWQFRLLNSVVSTLGLFKIAKRDHTGPTDEPSRRAFPSTRPRPDESRPSISRPASWPDDGARRAPASRSRHRPRTRSGNGCPDG